MLYASHMLHDAAYERVCNMHNVQQHLTQARLHGALRRYLPRVSVTGPCWSNTARMSKSLWLECDPSMLARPPAPWPTCPPPARPSGRPQSDFRHLSCRRHLVAGLLSGAVSIALSVCARRLAQFRVGVAAWGMGSRNKPLAIKKIIPAVITAKFEKTCFCIFFTSNGRETASVWSADLKPSTQQQSHRRLEVDIESRSRKPARVDREPPTAGWPAITATVRQRKVLQTQACTSQDTS